MNGEAGRSAGGMHRLVDRIQRFFEYGQIWVALAVAGMLLLLQLPGIEDVAEKIGLENSTRLRTAVGILVLSSILLEVWQLNRRVTPAITGKQHYSDPNEMYNALIEKAAEINNPEQRRIEVLGLTLFSAWPQLEFFLERPGVSGWTVRLAALAKDAGAPRQWVPKTWPRESATTVAQVEQFKLGWAVDHNHTIEVFEYHFTPVVHGFRLGTGDVFLSTLRWQDGRLGKHRFPYDYVPASDISAEADAARALFGNWFDRAVRSAGEAAGRGDGDAGSPPSGQSND
jgi:uncharacterized membrane protein